MHLIEGFVFIKSALVQLAASILANKINGKEVLAAWQEDGVQLFFPADQRVWIKDEQAPAQRK
jgi:hypothetical protein